MFALHKHARQTNLLKFYNANVNFVSLGISKVACCVELFCSVFLYQGPNLTIKEYDCVFTMY